ncbi:hypothetical protein ACH9L7_01285 [Haloferax sp. S1W]|uniref:hypothetical protein n=1 Tax=Haloferax sp. S1W TaxID=3377110 RepID=UPI0037C92BCF
MGESKEKSRESERDLLPIFVMIAILLLILPATLYSITPYLPVEYLELVTVVDISASMILSLALVYIYLSLNQIQDTQTEILDTQTSLMQMGKVPNISVTSWEVEDNLFQFSLANLGQGVATNISTGIKVVPQNIDYHEDFQVYTTGLYQDREQSRKNFISGNETQEFVGPAIATTVVDSVQKWEFTRVINHLCDKGESEIEFVIMLTFQNMFQERTKFNIISYVTEIHKDMTLEEAITDSPVTNTVAPHIPPKQVLKEFHDLDQSGSFFYPAKVRD